MLAVREFSLNTFVATLYRKKGPNIQTADNVLQTVKILWVQWISKHIRESQSVSVQSLSPFR